MVKIFVGRLVDSIDKERLTELFSKYGEVVDCEVLKNFGFVHMADKKDAEKAISELDKSEVEGQAINVEFSVTKVASAAKLFVGNLAEGTQSHELHKLFKKYGSVIECDVIKNYGFVHMSRESQAREAIKELHDYELNGNKIRVQMARTRGPGPRGSRTTRVSGYGQVGPRYNPYAQGDVSDFALRSRGYPRSGMDRMVYESGMRRDASARRGAPSYFRLLRERAMLARRLITERDVAGYRDAYSGAVGLGGGAESRMSRGLSAGNSAYTDFSVDDFGDLPLEDNFAFEDTALGRYGGPSGYGMYY